MKDILKRLVTVKSIVTLILTLIFAFLAIRGDIGQDKYYDIFLMVISFYFGVQTAKNKE